LNTALATKRAVGYLRGSTPGQTGDQHSSLETQELGSKSTASGKVSCPTPSSWTLYPAAGTTGKSTDAW